MRRLLLTVLAALAVVAGGCDSGAPETLARVEQATVESGAADHVFGQPSMAVGTEPTTTSHQTTHFPAGVASDALSAGTGVVWIADRDAHRILGVPREPTMPWLAWYLVGQVDFSAHDPNGGGSVTGATLRAPSAVAMHRSFLAVADTGNHRVLYGQPMSAWPHNVFGQGDSFESAERNKGATITAGTLADPSGVAFDLAPDVARLIVTDTGNHRVLIYPVLPLPSTTATQCFGQPDCSSGAPNGGGSVGRGTLHEPRGLAAWNALGDPLRGFYVADTGNHRVLHYPAFSSLPDLVYGQSGDFTTAIPSKGGTSSRSLRAPTGVAVDRDGSLWVADTGHHRVLHFPKGSTTADRVLGQPSMDAGSAPAAPDASHLRAPESVAVSTSEVFVADTGFSRVLRYQRACDAAVCADGNICTDDVCTPSGCANPVVQFPKACRGQRCSMNACVPCSATAPCQAGHLCFEGVCAMRCTNDSACTSGGKCVDGYCCDRACDGPCESCKERGAVGRCTAVAGAPPKGKVCSSSGECGGRCNGVDGSRCVDAFAGEPCGVDACFDGVAQGRGTCRSDGSCSGTSTTCAPYACDVGGCRVSCRWDFQCASGASCVEGECLPGAGITPGGGCALGAPTTGKFALFGVALAIAAVLRRRR